MDCYLADVSLCSFDLDPAKMLDVMNVGTGINFSTKESFRTDVRSPRHRRQKRDLRFSAHLQLTCPHLRDSRAATSLDTSCPCC